MSDRLARGLTLLLTAAGAVGALWLAVRFLLPWTAPFLAAWLLAAALEAPVGWLERHGWRRGAAAGLCTLLALGLLLWGLAALVWKGVGALTDFVQQLPGQMEQVQTRLAALQSAAERGIRSAPAGSAFFWEQGLAAFHQALAALPGAASRAALGFLSRTAQASPDTALFLVTMALGTYFLSAAFPTVRAFLLAQLPDSLRRRLEGLGKDLRGGFGGVLRAQLILMLMTFFVLTAAFLLLRIPNALGLAALTALIDALPVFGAGIVLLPWALTSLLLGSTRRALGLLLSWGTVTLVRSLAQAKLLGDQIGLDPLASLLSVYVGWRVCGVWGMLVFPLLLLGLIQLNDRGVLRLWKEG